MIFALENDLWFLNDKKLRCIHGKRNFSISLFTSLIDSENTLTPNTVRWESLYCVSSHIVPQTTTSLSFHVCLLDTKLTSEAFTNALEVINPWSLKTIFPWQMLYSHSTQKTTMVTSVESNKVMYMLRQFQIIVLYQTRSYCFGI